MAMGKRQDSTQGSLFIPTASLARSSSHAFYERLNQVLAKDGFDAFSEGLCAPYYVEGKGRPGIPPGTYFRMHLAGYFEGLESERLICWRVAALVKALRALAKALLLALGAQVLRFRRCHPTNTLCGVDFAH